MTLKSCTSDDAKELNNGKCNPNHYIPDGSVTKEEAEQALITDQKDGEKADPEQLKHAALWCARCRRRRPRPPSPLLATRSPPRSSPLPRAVYDQNWQWPILDWFAEMALNKQKLLKAIEAIGKAMIKKYEDPPPEVPEEKPEGGYPTPTSNTIPAEDLPKWAPGKRVDYDELRKYTSREWSTTVAHPDKLFRIVTTVDKKTPYTPMWNKAVGKWFNGERGGKGSRGRGGNEAWGGGPPAYPALDHNVASLHDCPFTDLYPFLVDPETGSCAAPIRPRSP